MSTAGYNERMFKIKKAGTVFAAVKSKSLNLNKEPVDVTTDDDDAWRRLLPLSGARSMDGSFEGVITVNNFNTILSSWEGNTFSDITFEAPNGDEWEAEDGFFLNSVAINGQEKGAVMFTASVQSSGAVTRTIAS